MSNFCPISMASDRLHDCGDRCIMYDWNQGGCLIKKALELYIKNNTPLVMHQPTEKELEHLTEMLKETLTEHPMEPMLFRHPDLNVKHDYDEYGVDWYPHGYDDIAP